MRLRLHGLCAELILGFTAFYKHVLNAYLKTVLRLHCHFHVIGITTSVKESSVGRPSTWWCQ
jgi:hypothetical protein